MWSRGPSEAEGGAFGPAPHTAVAAVAIGTTRSLAILSGCQCTKLIQSNPQRYDTPWVAIGVAGTHPPPRATFACCGVADYMIGASYVYHN